MNSQERVMRSLDYKVTDRVARFYSYWHEFEEICRTELGLASDILLDNYFDIDILIVYPDQTTFPSLQRVINQNDYEVIMLNG